MYLAINIRAFKNNDFIDCGCYHAGRKVNIFFVLAKGCLVFCKQYDVAGIV